MELKMTTLRALKFEEKSGKDLIDFLKQVGDTGKISVKDIVLLFEACGDGYTVEMFDQWDANFTEKVTAIMEAVKVFIGADDAKN